MLGILVCLRVSLIAMSAFSNVLCILVRDASCAIGDGFLPSYGFLNASEYFCVGLLGSILFLICLMTAAHYSGYLHLTCLPYFTVMCSFWPPSQLVRHYFSHFTQLSVILSPYISVFGYFVRPEFNILGDTAHNTQKLTVMSSATVFEITAHHTREYHICQLAFSFYLFGPSGFHAPF